MHLVRPQRSSKDRYFLRQEVERKNDECKDGGDKDGSRDDIAIVAADFYFTKCAKGQDGETHPVGIRSQIDQLNELNSEMHKKCEALEDRLEDLVNQMELRQEVLQAQSDLYLELQQKFEAFQDTVVPIHDRAVLCLDW